MKSCKYHVYLQLENEARKNSVYHFMFYDNNMGVQIIIKSTKCKSRYFKLRMFLLYIIQVN